MLSNCEKMVAMSSIRNEWPERQTDDRMASSGGIMEKPGQDLIRQQQQQQQALKCPRCDSSNTKFCYYNNYSLSQPRHFCKSCKRYWTRGGTLRNVPVGGGCRKNKRVKRTTSNSAIDSASSPSATSANSNPTNSQPQMIDNIIASTSNHINPIFYGLSVNSSDMNFPFSRFNSRVSGGETISGYDLQPQLNALGLGFSSGILSNEVSENNVYRNGFGLNNTLFSSYNNSAPISTPVMASLLSSTFQQQKFINGGMIPLGEMQIAGNNSSEAEMGALKEVKVEEQGQNRSEWITNNGDCQNNQMEQRVGLSDPNSSLYWNAATAWNEQTHNIVGSSISSLI